MDNLCRNVAGKRSCTQSRCGGAETEARASGVLEKGQHHGLAAQGGEFLQGVALDFLKGFGLIENE